MMTWILLLNSAMSAIPLPLLPGIPSRSATVRKSPTNHLHGIPTCETNPLFEKAYMTTPRPFEGSEATFVKSTLTGHPEVGVFVKIYNGDNVTYDQVTRQIELLKTLNTLKKDEADPIAPYFYGACKDDEHLYIVTEYFPGKDLFDYVQEQGGFLKMEEAKDIIREILIIIDVLHNQGNIVHRDLKMENFMLNRTSVTNRGSMKQNEFDVDHIVDRGTLKLIDFGDSRIISDCINSPNHGTQRYQAPEMSAQSYNEKVDIYSAGIMFLDMITGDTTDCPTTKPMNQSLNSIERDFVQKMVAEDQNERWSAKDLLGHQFFNPSQKNFGFGGLQKRMNRLKYLKTSIEGKGKRICKALSTAF